MDPIKLFGGIVAVLLIAWLIIAGPIGSIIGLGEESGRLLGAQIRHCPEGIKIEEFPNRMALYLDADAGVLEPSYSIDIFEEYRSCQQKGVFSSQEVQQFEPEIINCAEAAYIAYVEFLDEKVKELEAMKDSTPKDYSTDYDPVSDEYEADWQDETQSADQAPAPAPPPTPISSPAADVKADLDYYEDLLKEYKKKHKIFKALYKNLDPQKI